MATTMPGDTGTTYRVGMRVSHALGDIRDEEYRHVRRFLEGCERILDVGCGTGTFLATDPSRIQGVDINPDNVQYCRERGLRAEVGSALQLPFPDSSFDGVISSHVMQVFNPNEAAQFMRELGRVVKPGGVIVITTLNWFDKFWRHPENVRAYPPDALRVYFSPARGSASPMFPGIPPMHQEAIWCRRPALVEFRSATNHTRNRIAGVINRAQYVARLRKYWRFDAYTVKLRCLKAAA